MCNLHSKLTTHEAMRQVYGVSIEHSHLGNIPALKAIYPKYEAPIVAMAETGERELVRSQWGFLTPNKSKKTGNWLKPQPWNNTRGDKVRSSGLWKSAFEVRRCLVPATAYTEATGRNSATFHWFNVKGTEGFAFAGIWKRQAGLVGETVVDGVFHSIVTTSPNKLAAKYHNRMSVILALSDYETWLTGDADDAFDLIEPLEDGKLMLAGEGFGLREQPT